MGGKKRKKWGPWVVRLQVRGEGVREEEGEVERGDEGRGSGERGLNEQREAGRGVGGLFGCQVTSGQPMASPDLMVRCSEEAECSHYLFSGAVSLSLRRALLFFLPSLSFCPPL